MCILHSLILFMHPQNRDETNKRDYLYYLAIGNTKLKEYATALKYIRALLQVEPGNRQAQVTKNDSHREF